jgi:hypothetical protein
MLRPRTAVAAFCLSLLVPSLQSEEPRPQVVGALPLAIAEASGLAPSLRAPGLFWVINDSGDAPMLYLITRSGALRGKVRLKGVRSLDWEDLAAFERDGQPWLAVGDIGDNKGARAQCTLHLLSEPDPTALTPDIETEVEPARAVVFTYEDGPHDIEAFAVDGKSNEAWFVTKRLRPNRVYRLALDPAEAPATARRMADLHPLPQPDATQSLLPGPGGRLRAQPTGLAFSRDLTRAALLTYGEILLFERKGTGSWAEALASAPRFLGPHGLLQAEAVAFSADAREIVVTSEGSRADIVTFSLR